MPWIRLPRSGKLAWDPEPYDDESRSLSDRAWLALRAGKRAYAFDLMEQIRQQEAQDPFTRLAAEFEQESRQTTRQQPESAPVDPFVDYLRSAAGEGKKK